VHGFGEGIASSGPLAYFQANDAETGEGYRLWRSDGTPAGTLQLRSEALLVLERVGLPGGGLFFTADELGVGIRLWRSDGTPAGTAHVAAPLAWSVPPHDFAVFGGAAWFLAAATGGAVEVWKSDLATGATASLPGPASGSTHLFTGAGKLFAANNGKLLATDGASILVVAEIAQASADSFTRVAQAGARVLFNVGGTARTRVGGSATGPRPAPSSSPAR
jgi:ELWxxDGT repeat protein